MVDLVMVKLQIKQKIILFDTVNSLPYRIRTFNRFSMFISFIYNDKSYIYCPLNAFFISKKNYNMYFDFSFTFKIM
ncbi:hypothetical protein KUTeg_009484 [Tegillarca granosa]|uniref:Uncharacterized protein n=1 Tax=Tegillarca granosa TaxID=220873 RepID=A0ABQ9F406_TEGGR|nr:hypothetical protein KUTeg_009484 [Tegillarca granosa]